MLHFSWLILFFPLLGSILLGLGGRVLSRRAVAILGPASILLAFVVTAGDAISIALGHAGAAGLYRETLFTWLTSGRLHIGLALQIDPLSVLFLLVVTGIGFLIHVYSVGYMAEDPDYARFFSYLNLFIFTMALLVAAGNFLFLLVGWGGVGVVSYLLIGFWYQRPSAVAAALKAFVINVIGDVGILLAIFLIFLRFHTLDFGGVFSKAASLLGGDSTYAVAITLLLFLGAAAKSAQLPLHTWLADAMEGPTPVSALIHAATMVTAGVYLVARCYPLYHAAPAAAIVVAGIGAATALVAATIGVVQHDIKRVLAYSTMSQIGYMIMAVGIGAYAAGLFHFLTHAFFKALLFMGAGNVIHALGGEQDMRRMGGLARKLPITYWSMLAGTLAISGVPLFSGFFSKDEILGATLSDGHPILWIIGVIAAGITAFYMFRLFFLTFSGNYRGTAHIHGEAPPTMLVPTVILAVGAVVMGYLAIPGVNDWLGGWLYPVFTRYPGGALAIPHVTQWGSMGLTTILAALGIYLAYRFYYIGNLSSEKVRQALPGLYRVVYNKYYFDELYAAVFIRPVQALGSFLGDVFDTGVIDGMVNGIGRGVGSLGEILQPWQSGQVRRYALSLVIGAAGILLYFTWLMRRG